MECANCKSENNEHAKYCKNCGASLEDNASKLISKNNSEDQNTIQLLLLVLGTELVFRVIYLLQRMVLGGFSKNNYEFIRFLGQVQDVTVIAVLFYAWINLKNKPAKTLIFMLLIVEIVGELYSWLLRFFY